MKIAIMGAGGMGAYYGGLLAMKRHEVTFIARGAHLQAILSHGLQVKSVFGDFQVAPARATDAPDKDGPVDLILFCTKTYDTDEAAQAAKALVGSATTVLSLQNGIDAVERIGRAVGVGHMIAGATWISSAIEAPGVIKQISGFRRVVIGELDGRITPRIQGIHDAFKETGINIELSHHIMQVLWTKFVFIAAASGFGSVTRLPIGSYRSVPETRILVTRLMQETAALAAAQHVSLDADVVEQSLAFMDQNAPHIKPSMQLDVESGHKMELESIIGVISRKGRELGVPTPVADLIYGALLPTDLQTR
jgi:2-dehydropantoate 2-reductase